MLFIIQVGCFNSDHQCTWMISISCRFYYLPTSRLFWMQRENWVLHFAIPLLLSCNGKLLLAYDREFGVRPRVFKVFLTYPSIFHLHLPTSHHDLPSASFGIRVKDWSNPDQMMHGRFDFLYWRGRLSFNLPCIDDDYVELSLSLKTKD